MRIAPIRIAAACLSAANIDQILNGKPQAGERPLPGRRKFEHFYKRATLFDRDAHRRIKTLVLAASAAFLSPPSRHLPPFHRPPHT